MRTGSPNHDDSNHSGAMWYWAGDSPMSGTVNVTGIMLCVHLYTNIDVAYILMCLIRPMQG